MHHRLKPVARRRWSLSLIVLLLLGLVVPLLPQQLAVAADTLSEAVTDAVAGGGMHAPAGLSVSPALERKGWSFGTAVLIGTEQGDGPPEVVFYIARQHGRGWQAAVEADQSAFNKLVRAAPTGFVPEVFLPAGAGIGAQDWKNLGDLELVMPFRIGETWTFLGGPHPEWDAPSIRNGIDLAPQGGGAGGDVFPAYAGWATTPCRISDSDGGPLVVVRHMNGWETHYFHLQNTVPLSGSVTLNTRLGTTSDRSNGGGCEGTASGPHLHFSLFRHEEHYPIAGLWIGGYQVQGGAEDYDGHLINKRIYYPNEGSNRITINRGGLIYNNGEFGSGAYINATKVIQGKKGELRFGHLPPRSQIELTLVYTPAGGTTRIEDTFKTITTNGAGGHRVVKFEVPKAKGRVVTIQARRLPGVNQGDLVYSLRKSVAKK